MPRVHAPAHIRFWNRVSGGDHTECWLWQGFISPNGYGRFSPALNEHYLAHRYVYELMRADIPEGLQIDHLCRVRACVTPGTLNPSTQTPTSSESPPTKPTAHTVPRGTSTRAATST